MRLLTLTRNTLRPGYAPEMVRKLHTRWRYRQREAADATAWAVQNTTPLTAWATAEDPALWEEARQFAAQMRTDVQPLLDELQRHGQAMGGGGCYELLYFLTRRLAPDAALETGVAAGWSTRAILSALRRNGQGHLWSSDFPYFRNDDPERYIGYLVPEDLKDAWTLYTKGDRANLKEILAQSAKIGLCHYDSDKSRLGRSYFMEQVTPHLLPGAVVVMDDIGDDLFFRDYVAGRSDYLVFEFHGKHLGMIRTPA